MLLNPRCNFPGPHFGSKLTITANKALHVFEVETSFPSKKLAKEAVARLAIESGLGHSGGGDAVHGRTSQPNFNPADFLESHNK